MMRISQPQALERGQEAARTAFRALESAIVDAWAYTCSQVEDATYEPPTEKMAFGYFLFCNVQDRIYKIAKSYSVHIIDAEFVPNQKGGSHHLVVTVNRWKATISAVPDEHSHPRDAQFRTSYAKQLRLNLDFGERTKPLVVVPPPELTSAPQTYIHLLHGPRPGWRKQLGFILVGHPNAEGRYDRAPVPLDTFLNETFGLDTDTTDVEVIEDDIETPLKNHAQ